MTVGLSLHMLICGHTDETLRSTTMKNWAVIAQILLPNVSMREAEP